MNDLGVTIGCLYYDVDTPKVQLWKQWTVHSHTGNWVSLVSNIINMYLYVKLFFKCLIGIFH